VKNWLGGWGRGEEGSSDRILRVVAILDENPLADVIGSFREKRSFESLRLGITKPSLGFAATREIVEVKRYTV
jgi:hypothetical protein